MMVILAITAIFSLLALFIGNTAVISSGLLNAIFDTYLFMIFYSLYCTFKEEMQHGLNAQQRNANVKA